MKIKNLFRHFHLITKHRHRVIANCSKCGLFWQSLGHDLSKYGPTEFFVSAKYYVGAHSPIFEERLSNFYFSSACQHHTRKNKHHWEYWTDFFCGRILAKTMPWNYATEFVCDMLSASITYDPVNFKPETTLAYFKKHKEHNYLTQATIEYVEWCLSRYAEMGFKGLKKKDTKAKYQEITSRLPQVEVFSACHEWQSLPPLR